jgi:acetolactate synthase-1/2/3 large subunit
MLKDQAAALDAPPARRAEQAPGEDAMEKVRLVLASAQRPLLVVGGSGWDAPSCRALQTFVERWSLPLVAAFRRQDLLDTRHDLYVGEFGPGVSPALVKHVGESDLLIVLGTRLGETSTSGYTLLDIPRPKQRIVQIHADPQELGRVYAVDLPIVATPSGFAAAAARLPSPDIPWRTWSRNLRQDYLAWSTPTASPGAVDMAAIVAGLARRLPPDAILANGAGNYTTWLHRFYPYRGFRTQLAPTSGAMGYGVPAAIAAQLVNPKRSVVVFAGDGCFLMSGQELITATRYGLPIIVVIVNNSSFGTIRMHQERFYPNRVFATDLVNPDFVALARAYGATGEQVTTTEAFWPALDRALAQHGPAVIEVVTDIETLSPQASVSGLRAAAKVQDRP